MRQHVTVVPTDNIVIVDGQALQFSFDAPATMHALQWHEGVGHIEWTDASNQPLTQAQYADDVAPYVALWEAEQARLEQEAAVAAAAHNSPAAVRERRIAAIMDELAAIDSRSARALRAIVAGTATEADTQALVALEDEAHELRAELTLLEGEAHAFRAELATLEATE